MDGRAGVELGGALKLGMNPSHPPLRSRCMQHRFHSLLQARHNVSGHHSTRDISGVSQMHNYAYACVRSRWGGIAAVYPQFMPRLAPVRSMPEMSAGWQPCMQLRKESLRVSRCSQPSPLRRQPTRLALRMTTARGGVPGAHAGDQRTLPQLNPQVIHGFRLGRWTSV